MAGKFSIPRFEHEDLDTTQELPRLPEEFESIPDESIPGYNSHPMKQAPQSYPKAPSPRAHSLDSFVPDVGPDDDFYPPARQPQRTPAPIQQYPADEYDPDEDLPEDFIDITLRVLKDLPGFFSRHWKKFALAACAIVLVVLACVIGSFASQKRDPYEEKILNNVIIADVLVGGMTKEQALAAVSGNLAGDYANKAMTIQFGGQAIKLDPTQVGAKLDVQAAVDAAYSYGRTGTQTERDQAYQNSLSSNYVMAVLPYLDLDEAYIRKTLEAIGEASVSALTQSTYELEGKTDSLSTETFNPAASAEILVITLGTPQIDFDADALYNQVLDAYSLGNFQVEAEGPVTTQEPDPVNLDAIYQEFFLEPVAPTLDMTEFDEIPGAYGRDFDLDTAKLQLAEAKPGDVLRIPMTYLAPEGDPTAVLYRDVLGEASTALSGDAGWDQNVRTAAKAIHNINLKPGDTFSLNAVLGQPLEAQGYVTAAVCGSKDMAGNVGEGVCQVASTLYIAALVSDMDVTARSPHPVAVSYTDCGKDANAYWGGPDFAFRNSSIYPVRIETEVYGSSLKIRIIGTDNRNYRADVEVAVSETIQPKIIYEEFPVDNAEGYEDGDVIQAGVNGYQVKTYKRKFDKGSGTLSSRDFIATSSYASQDTVIARVAPPVVETPSDPPSESIDLPDNGSGSVEAVG